MQEGVRELTQDISKLVNLRVLHLSANDGVDHLPEAISCLQRLELLRVDMCPVSELPNGLTALANLSGLHITWNGPLGPAFPPGLQVWIRPSVAILPQRPDMKTCHAAFALTCSAPLLPA